MNALSLSLRNAYTNPQLNRCSEKRQDESWFTQRLQNQDSGFYVFLDTTALMTKCEKPELVILSPDMLSTWFEHAESIVYLGDDKNRSLFVIAFAKSISDQIEKFFACNAVFRELRSVVTHISDCDSSRLAYARAITLWHRHHFYCARCGGQTESKHAGHMRQCVVETCKSTHFPRTDPAVIMLVTDGTQCLLGRQTGWPEHRYSVLAGFVEPGESAEQAVVREVFEETGIHVDEVQYHSSQPWPFPGSLMMGYFATATQQKINLRDQELEHAFWVDRETLLDKTLNQQIRLSPRDSISFRLIEEWFNSEHISNLDDVLLANSL